MKTFPMRVNWFFFLPMACGTIAFALWLWWSAGHKSSVPFLPRGAPAEWMVYPSPFSAAERRRVELDTRFRKQFLLKDVSTNAELSLCAFTRCIVLLNDMPVSLPNAQRNWKEPLTVDVSNILHAGQNTIEITVYNEAGPPALWLWLRGKGLVVCSDTSWEASYAGAVWRPTRLANEPGRIIPGNPVYGGERGVPSLVARWPELVLFLFISATLFTGGCWWFSRAKASAQTFGSGVFTDPAAGCLAVMILCWILFFSHNANLLPRTIGFDAPGHMDYINYIQQRERLPLADEGMAMYNPPFYYLMGAGALGICGLRTADFAGVVVLRYLGMIIGIVHLLLVWGSLRLIFPRRTGQQVVGLLLAGFVPAQFYLSHYVTNEVLASVLVTATLYVCLRALQDDRPSPRRFAGVGAVMGLALLTKFTAVLMVPFVVGAMAFRLFQKAGRDLRTWLKTAGVALLTCLLVCGWHYGRVWAHFGKPLLGNWEPSAGQFGWQDPGYRTSSYFLRLGESLSSPFFSGQASLADAIYSTLWGDGYCAGVSGLVVRPPWNYELMAVGYLLALLPSLLIGLGALISLGRLIRRPTAEGVLLNGLAWSFVAALLHMALKFPTYALVKAFYGLLILLPVCVFGAVGWEFLIQRRKFLRSSLSIGLGLWALTTCSAYWISRNSAPTNLLLGLDLAIDAKPEKAVPRLSAALAANPTNVVAKSLLADALTEIGQPTAAERLRKELVNEHPESALSQMARALTAENEGRLAEAVEHNRRAAKAAPEEVQYQQRLVSRLMKLEEPGQAIAACREALESAPADSQLHTLLGMALLHPTGSSALSSEPQSEPATNSRQLEEGFRHLRLACQLAADSFEPLNKLAWVLATYPDARWRNGDEAVQLAERVCALTNYRLPEGIGTLAVANAEAGRFEAAISAAQQAQTLARELGQTQLVELHKQWIKLFRAGQPYRERSKNP